MSTSSFRNLNATNTKAILYKYKSVKVLISLFLREMKSQHLSQLFIRGEVIVEKQEKLGNYHWCCFIIVIQIQICISHFESIKIANTN